MSHEELLMLQAWESLKASWDTFMLSGVLMLQETGQNPDWLPKGIMMDISDAIQQVDKAVEDGNLQWSIRSPYS